MRLKSGSTRIKPNHVPLQPRFNELQLNLMQDTCETLCESENVHGDAYACWHAERQSGAILFGFGAMRSETSCVT